MSCKYLDCNDIVEDAKWHIAHEWTNTLTAKVLRRVYHVELTSRCICAIRTGKPCSKKCPMWREDDVEAV